MTVEKQMTMAFMNGGMVTDGKKKDPVSGNEVPAGSSAEEVRDDVDAKLSKGEFVMPADVVQFIGVDKLEKMINKAKEGLAEMEAGGRMGQPVEEPVEDEMPLSEEELAAIISGGEEKGFAEGGFVSNQSAVENRTFINPQGHKRQILFINGQPIQQVPEGFTPHSMEAEAAITGGEARTTQDLGTSTEDHWEDSDATPQKPIEEYTASELKDLADQGGFTRTLSKAMAGAIPGAGSIMGGMINKVYSERSKLAATEIDKRLEAGNLSPEDSDFLSSAQESLKKDSERKSGKGLLGSLLPENGLLGGALGGDDEDDEDGGLLSGLTDLFGSFNKNKAQPKTESKTTNPQSQPVKKETLADKRGDDGFSKGGLVKKRKK
jgi:hypothetical protein